MTEPQRNMFLIRRSYTNADGSDRFGPTTYVLEAGDIHDAFAKVLYTITRDPKLMPRGPGNSPAELKADARTKTIEMVDHENVTVKYTMEQASIFRG